MGAARPRTQGGDSPLHTKRSGLRGSQPCQHRLSARAHPLHGPRDGPVLQIHHGHLQGECVGPAPSQGSKFSLLWKTQGEQGGSLFWERRPRTRLG